MEAAIFLPVRKGSVRITEKNTRPFAGIPGGLLEMKLGQLIKLEGIREILVSTNDEIAQEIAAKFLPKSEKLKIIPRVDELSNSDTDLSDLIKYVPQITELEHILWTHVTSPFCTEVQYTKVLEKYVEIQKLGYDSLVGVQRFQNFLWDKEKREIINRKGHLRWPRTQDLKPLFEINNAVFLAPRATFLEGNRLGENPFLHEMNKFSSWDIDDKEDFEMAEALYGKL